MVASQGLTVYIVNLLISSSLVNYVSGIIQPFKSSLSLPTVGSYFINIYVMT